MQKFIETTGDTRDAAIEAALKQLGMDRDDVSVEVLDNGKKGFLGIGATPARVRVTYEVPDEPVKQEEPVRKSEDKPAAERKAAEKKEKPAPKQEKPAEKPQKLSITDEDDTPRLVKAAPADFVPEKLEIERPPRRDRLYRVPGVLPQKGRFHVGGGRIHHTFWHRGPAAPLYQQREDQTVSECQRLL